MPRYELFAARDGDTFRDETIQCDDEAAERWARQRIIAEFGLQHLADREFDEIVAETDGVELNMMPPDPVGAFMLDWLMAQAQLIEPLRKHFDGKFATHFRSYRGGILDLFLAIQADLEGRNT